MNILATTNHAFLAIDIDTGNAKVIDRAHGLYYGIAYSNQAIYVAARNSQSTTKETKAQEDGSILVYDFDLQLKDEIRAPFPLRDLHQIVYYDQKLWMTCSYDDWIAIYDGERWERWQPCTVAAGTPDQKHFNSLYFDAEHVYVLAHNYGPSQIYRCRLSDRQIEQVIALGTVAHNIWQQDGAIYTCSSGSGTIESTNGFRLEVGSFPRGVVVTDDRIIIGISEAKQRDQRIYTTSSIRVFDRRWKQISEIQLPKEGLLLDLRAPGLNDQCYPVTSSPPIVLSGADLVMYPAIPHDSARGQLPTAAKNMSEQPNHQGEFFSAGLDHTELEQILRRIDENLALRPILNQPAADTAGLADTAMPALPDWGDIGVRLQELHGMQAPLFVIKGRGLPDLLKRALNLPIRIFGRKQLRHNREQLELIERLLAQIQGLRQHAQAQAAELARVRATAQQLPTLQAAIEQLGTSHDQLNSAVQGQYRWNEQISTDVQQLASGLHGQHSWLDELARNQHGQSEWIELLQRKQAMLALDMRERLDQPTSRELPEPQIIDPERYQQRLAELAPDLRVNLGCGEKPLPGYINADFRPVPDADIAADVRRLPFEPASLAEIASAHLVEHFREHQLRVVIVPYWRELLRPGGLLRIICPNWAAMLERLNDGRMSLATFKLLTFGGQDYEGDDHFAMYTPETLSALLREAGFTTVELAATDRMNGLCPEMEVLAYR